MQSIASIIIFSFLVSICSATLSVAFQRSYTGDFIGCMMFLLLHIATLFALCRTIKPIQKVLPGRIINFMLRFSLLFDLAFALICLIQGNQSGAGDFLSDFVVCVFLLMWMETKVK